MRVLVVDDNIIDRRFIKYTLLNHLNICAETARDGQEAMQKITATSFDLVITDIVMPNIEGIELINNIQASSPKTKIIAVSGNNPYYLYIVKKLGIDSVFTKPLDVEAFVACINDILHIHQRSQKATKATKMI